MTIKLLTINLHKGFSPLNKRFILPQLRRCIHSTSADVIFMQEVVGENLRKAAKHKDWPDRPQHEYIAGEAGFDHVYGKNAVYTFGHHGNAILSRYPILFFEQVDISTNRLEKRGMLYAKLKLPGKGGGLHCVCIHLGLLHRSRKKQLGKLSEFIRKLVPGDEPLIVAGDFNEWRRGKKDELETRLCMKDAGLELYGHKLRTFPSVLPVFPLDRIYLRGFKTLTAAVVDKGCCARLSDHAGFFAEVERIQA
ncbi:MAG: endonuclease/exonuclease/phosphatase family protein [Elusimicrobia bacterium]|nr:endonuclease/exonuclease/phosphatase family protein [Elusimicrobiota bacterium]